MERWIVTPQNTPVIVKSCSKCGNGSRFSCSGNFRVNANGRSLDVWLIYRCQRCDTTWNMEILSRVKPTQIDQGLYRCFVKNDYETAKRYAFNLQLLNKNKATPCFDEMGYTVIRTTLETQSDEVNIICEYDFGLRLDRLLSDQLALSRTKVKALIEKGVIYSEDGVVTSKTKVRGNLNIRIKLM